MAEPSLLPSYEKASQFMRPFAIGATAYLAVLNMLHIITRGRIVSPDRWADIYLVILAVYAGAGEVKRWATGADEIGSPADEQLRRGGPIITLWIALLFFCGTWRVIDSSRPMPPELYDIAMKVLGLFFGTYAVRQVARRRATARSTDEDEISAVLRAVKGGNQRPGDIAAHTGIPPRTLARLLKRLTEDKRLLRDAAGPTDPQAKYRVPE